MIIYADRGKISFCEINEDGSLEVIIDGVHLTWGKTDSNTEKAINVFKSILEA